MNVIGTLTLPSNGDAFVSSSGVVIVGLYQTTGDIIQVYGPGLTLLGSVPATGNLPLAFGVDPSRSIVVEVEDNGAGGLTVNAYSVSTQTLLWTATLPNYTGGTVAVTVGPSGLVGVAYGTSFTLLLNGVVSYTSGAFMGDILDLVTCGNYWIVATSTGIYVYTPPFAPPVAQITLSLTGPLGVSCSCGKLYIIAPGVGQTYFLRLKCGRLRLKNTIPFSTLEMVPFGDYFLALTGSLVLGLYRYCHCNFLYRYAVTVGTTADSFSLDRARSFIVTTSGTTLTLLQRF